MKKIKVLFIASELNPIAKVGGLADVVGALPKALAGLGVDIRIVIPRYGNIDATKYPMTQIAADVPVPFNGTTARMNVLQTPLPGTDVPVYLLENQQYLSEGKIYFEQDASSSGSTKEAHRFVFLSRACFEMFEPLNWYPDIIHCHDWHVGMVPLLTHLLAKERPQLRQTKTVFTIHNLEYQGWYAADIIMSALGLTTDSYPTLGERRGTHLSTLVQALLTSDRLTTVSPNYATEILTSEYGGTIEAYTTRRQADLSGILNGIDTERFNPAADPAIAQQFSADDPAGKEGCKAALQKNCGLAVDPQAPLLGIVSRMADQKGIDLLAAIMPDIVTAGAQLIILGTGDPAVEQLIKSAAQRQAPQSVALRLEFNASLAQQIYAGADMFLMPSKFEPCGLGQMIAMRYGAVPIVRATGGLKDTVHDYDPGNGQGDGFVFQDYDARAFFDAITRAVALYRDRQSWHTVAARVMRLDFSWTASATKYLQLYQQITT